MAIRKTGKKGDRWVVQVQVKGRRRGRRVRGTRKDAKAVEAAIRAELEDEARMNEAAALLGLDQERRSVEPPPTLQLFFRDRWVPHARVVQNENTRTRYASRWRYILYFLGDKRIDEVSLADVNEMVEALQERGPISFARRKDGELRRPPTTELATSTINGILACLRAALRFAEAEGHIATAPRINLLPEDRSEGVVAPSEEQLRHLLQTAAGFTDRAPFMPELIEFVSLTGLRGGEVFNLTWASVEFPRRVVRIEKQRRTVYVNQRTWTPKGNKFREVPLSHRATAILRGIADQLEDGPQPDRLVFPNKGGCPYLRRSDAPLGAGQAWFPQVVKSADLKGKVTLHSLRHMFAVRMLTRGIPITVVSDLLGHSDINLTVKRYGRYSSDARVRWEAVDILDHPAEFPGPAHQPRLGVIQGGKGKVGEGGGGSA